MKYLFAVLASALLLFGSACSEEGELLVPLSPSPVATPSLSDANASIQDAIREYLALNGIVYAGDCATTDIDTDIGKYCSSVTPNGEDRATAIIGPTFSEYISTLTLSRTDEGWVVTDATPIEYPDPLQNGG